MDRIAQILDHRRRLVEEARSITNKAYTEKRDMSAEESARYDAIFVDVEKDTKEAERLQKLAMAERLLETPTELIVPGTPVQGNGRTEKRKKSEQELELESRAVDRFIQGGVLAMSETERRDLQATTDSAGGYLFAPEQFLARLIVALKNQVFMRALSYVIQVTSSDTLGVPNLSADVADPDWTSEVGTISADSAMTLGKRQLVPTQLTKLAKVSEKLLRIAAIDPQALVVDRIAYKFAVALENGYLNGSGVAQPLGVFTASNNGIPTSRDVATGNTTTDVTPEGILNALYSIKAQYRRSPSFAFLASRELVKRLSKMRTNIGGAGTGEFLWEPSLKVGEPDRFKGVPVYESEYVPSTYTTGLYVGLFGDMSWYWIADLAQFRLQRLNELFALNSQVGFIGRLESDGAPVLAEAFSRITLA